jgi:glycosyltransferase involved in cell wall biosynthesis
LSEESPDAQRPWITVVIPYHNEEQSLPELIRRLSATMDASARCFEVLLIDDVSTDRSLERARQATAGDPRYRNLALAERGGQTGAFKAAFAAARGEYVIRMDADLQDDPRDLPLFIDKLDAGYQLVIGYRRERQHSLLLRWATNAYDFVTSRMFHTELHSNSGSFIAFKAALIKNIPFRHNDHRYLPLIAIRRGANPTGSVDVRHGARRYGSSKYSLARKLLTAAPEVLRFYLRYYRGYYDLAEGAATAANASERAIRSAGKEAS